MRVLAAVSGGVDSAVAAARARDAGHDVTCVHLAVSRAPAQLRSGSRGCCSREDARDAARVADVLGLPFYVWDVSEQFSRDVVDDFVEQYAQGRTPNPCLRCNESIKFAAVADRALALGFDAVATGHHARLVDHADGTRTLHRSVDAAKDQSYVLAVCDASRLAPALLPLGDATKAEVRAEAAARGLGVADKPDSSDVCFVADGDTPGFLRDRLGEQPGDVVDAATGAVLGGHRGAYAYTVGQRRGLGLSVPAPDGRPRFVLSVEPAARRVTVGPREALAVTMVRVGPPTWCGPDVGLPRRAVAQLSAHGEPVPCTAASHDGGLVVALDEPVHGVAPGQTVVLYQGDRALGSATVTSST